MMRDSVVENFLRGAWPDRDVGFRVPAQDIFYRADARHGRGTVHPVVCNP